MTKTELAYIAGLFDGEGDLGIYLYRATKNGKQYPKLTARIHNTHKEALDWVQEKIGFGKVYRDRKGIKKSGHYGKKQVYVFIVTHKQARNFLPLVLPYLIIKKKKAIELTEKDNLYFGRNKLYARVAQLVRAKDS